MQDLFTQSYPPPPPQSAIKDRTPNNAPNTPNNGEIELPTHITSNLKNELRNYQKQAINNYLEKRQSNPFQKHFMFEMATGSGKTLVMAGLILECCKQGYQNFIFFVNSTSILEKTKLSFTDSVSSKYLFSENININDENTEIKSINNLNESQTSAINIYFSTIQGLFSLFTKVKENAISIEDLKDRKLVFLADEAHHLNTETKKKLNDAEFSEKRFNLNESQTSAINIYFSTIQGLFSLFTKAKENAISIEDLKDQKLVFLADEAHHLNTETKKKLSDAEFSEKHNWESVVKLALEQNKDNLLLEFHNWESVEKLALEQNTDNLLLEFHNWESVVKLALEQNKDNLLLEFSATIPNEKSVKDKYENLKVITYTLKEFSEDKFCKNIYPFL